MTGGGGSYNIYMEYTYLYGLLVFKVILVSFSAFIFKIPGIQKWLTIYGKWWELLLVESGVLVICTSVQSTFDLLMYR